MKREEAIETIRRCCPRVGDSQCDFETALRELIPELAESEDERIRKFLVDILSSGTWRKEWPFSPVDCVAYLEKQKEQKPISFNEPYNPDDYEVVVEGNATGLKRKEQKPTVWKPQPDALEALMYAIEGRWEMIKPTSYLSRRLEDLYEGLVNNFDVDETLIADKDIEELKALKAEIEASVEQKSAEKQDYSGLSKLERAIHRGFLAAGVENVPVGIIKETAQECLEQMKPAEWNDMDMKEARDNLISVCRDWERGKQTALLPIVAVRARYFLEHLAEPMSAEWSEDDELKMNALLKYLDPDAGGTKYSSYAQLTEWYNWLKSLQPSWKPSEEQMKALRNAVNKLAKSDVADSVRLSIMYDNIKKLM